MFGLMLLELTCRDAERAVLANEHIGICVPSLIGHEHLDARELCHAGENACCGLYPFGLGFLEDLRYLGLYRGLGDHWPDTGIVSTPLTQAISVVRIVVYPSVAQLIMRGRRGLAAGLGL